MIISFCGHGDIYYDEKIKEKFCLCVEELIKNGAEEFLLGGYGNFDCLAAMSIKNLKHIYPHIISTLVIPYIDRSFDKNIYDNSVYPPLEKIPKKYAILKRNEWMIQHCDVLVCYISRTYGGAYISYSYAKKNKKQIINLAKQN